MLLLSRPKYAFTIGRAREENCLHQMTSWVSVSHGNIYASYLLDAPVAFVH